MIKDLKVEGSMKLALLFYKSNYTDDDLLLIESGLRRLRMAKRVIREVIIIIAYLIESLKLNKYYLRKAINKLGFSNLEAIINVKRHLELEDEDKLLEILDLAILIETKKEVTSLEDLKITGKDLIKIGIDEGPLIGEILNFLLKEVINGHIANEYNSLIKAAREKNIIKTF
jgi:tRNA nucleotidyltransferase (CCA-adding enzyme)